MSDSAKIKDKNRASNKVVIIALMVIVFLFILIRIIAINANDGEGVAVIKPDLDSVNLKNNTSKIEQFETAKMKELEAANEDNNSPVNYNFKKMFGVTTETVALVAEVKSEPTEPLNEPIKKSNLSYGKYKQVDDAYNEPVVKKQKTIIEEPKIETKQIVEPQQIVQVKAKTNPFGTTSSVKTLSSNSGLVVKDTYKCFLHSDQKIKNGNGVIFRAGEDLILESRIIKKNSILYGSAKYSGQRVLININRVKSSAGEFEVNLNVYDNDFVKGIFFKNAYDEISEKTTDDVANNTTNKNKQVKGAVGTVIDLGIQAGKNIGDAVKKERSLNLEEGYIIYVKEVLKNEKN